MVEADARSRLAPLHEVSEKHHLLGRGRPKVASPAFVPRPDTAWTGRGTAFGRAAPAKRRCTLLAAWNPEQEEPWVIWPWVILAVGHPDRPSPRPSRGELVRAALLDRVGVQGAQEPGLAMAEDSQDRPNPRLPALAGAAGGDIAGPGLWHPGGNAYDRRIAPGSLRAPPEAPAPKRRDPWGRPVRTVSVIRHGIAWLRRLLHRGRFWSRVWLLPEPWPEHKSTMEVTRLVPP